MNYEEFRCWRDRVASQKPALRLDCMNPAKALDHILTVSSNVGPIAETATLRKLWHAVLGLDNGIECLVLGVGVRDILRALFGPLANPDRTFWLPSDVYPVYWKLLGDRDTESFKTIPTLDLSFLERTSLADCLLLPSPLSPEGRSLTANELGRLTSWLEASQHRHLILDGVYNFAFPILDPNLTELISTHGCISLFSTSKSWLAPQVTGVAITSPTLQPVLQESVAKLSESQRATAAQLLAHESELPAKIQHRFEQQWKRLNPQIHEVDPEWQPPETGYFSTICVACQSLWHKHDILAVPASVFGSDEPHLSVITCLFDIKSHDLAVAQS